MNLSAHKNMESANACRDGVERESPKRAFLLRFKRASFRELAYRAKQIVVTDRLKGSLGRGSVPPGAPEIDVKDVLELRLPGIRCEVGDDVIEQILGGGRFCLNADERRILDYEAKNRGLFFADVRSSASDPDIRMVWEAGRLQHLTALFAMAREGRGRFDAEELGAFATREVLRWIEENPFLYGPHYMSAMECGLRVPVFLHCLKAIEGNPDNPAFQAVLNAIYQHAWWVAKRLSLYSSLGNHTICECVGLVFAGAVYRKAKEGRRWLTRGMELLLRELDHQILEDGGPAEQSLGYHRFVLDLYWMALDFLERNDLAECDGLRPKLLLGEQFLAAFEDENGVLPALGDVDDGCAVGPGLFPKRGHVEKRAQEGYSFFAESGYTVIKGRGGLRFTFDHGPLGMSPLYNHGHADALSVTLSAGGREIIVDSGAYRYNGAPEWRQYFKGSRSHNTVCIDGLDQAVQETSFIWIKPFENHLLEFTERDDGLYVEALHTGYTRLKEPVWHKRAVLFLAGSAFILKDTFAGSGRHAFELNFHFHPEISLAFKNGWWVAERAGTETFITTIGDVSFDLAHGQESPPLGWHSPSYGVKVRCIALSARKRCLPEEASFLTVISVGEPLERLDIERVAASL